MAKDVRWAALVRGQRPDQGAEMVQATTAAAMELMKMGGGGDAVRS